MKASNVVALIVGILVIVGGVYCMMAPGATYLSLAWLLGLVMVADGIADIFTWSRLRNEGYSNGWALVAAVLSIILGVIVLTSSVAQLAVDLFIAYMIAAWLIITGIMRIMFGWRMHQFHQQLNTRAIGRNWWLTFLLGILLLIVGVISLFNPSGLMIGIGLLVGLSIIVAGISVVALAL